MRAFGRLTVALLLAACSEGSRVAQGPAQPVRELTPGGYPALSYDTLPMLSPSRLEFPLRIGTLDGEVTFADVRGVELSDSGHIVVLDILRSEITSFDTVGTRLAVLARSGEGPREIADANGLFFDSAGVLWVNNGGSMRVIGLRSGEQVATLPFAVPGWRYLWKGGISQDGKTWTEWFYPILPEGGPPPARRLGYVEDLYAYYFISYDPASGEKDSLFVGELPLRAINVERASINVPYRPERLNAFDSRGAVWTARNDEYALTRLNLGGDTTVTVRVGGVPAPTITAEERASEVRGIEDRMERVGRVNVDWNAAIPRTKPVLQHLTVDDEGRVWVQRPDSSGVRFDVFDSDGSFVHSYVASVDVYDPFPPVVRRGRLLTVQSDSLGAQYVIGARIP